MSCAEDLARAAAFDHTAAAFVDNRRNRGGFVRSNCIALDLDNDLSDDPADWKDLTDIAAAFPHVGFFAVESRNHRRRKGEKAPRPKYHVYFPISSVNSAVAYEKMKQRALSVFPFFDSNAIDAARFFFGVESPRVHTVEGSLSLDAYLLCFASPPETKTTPEARQTTGKTAALPTPPMPNERHPVISVGADVPEGNRNSELYRLAFLRFMQGLPENEVQLLVEAANGQFSAPLPADEVVTIIRSACSKPLDRAANIRRAELAIEFSEAAQSAKASRSEIKDDAIQCLSGMQERQPEWLLPGLIPRNEITLLAGDGGVGKTFCWCSIAAGISSGQVPGVFRNPFSDDLGGLRPERVLFLSSEDSASAVLLPRLRVAGADLSRIYTVDCTTEVFPQLRFGSPALEKLISKIQPGLVVFDPLQAFLPRGVDMAKRNDMRSALGELHALGQKNGTTFLIVLHTNKVRAVWGRQRIADSADLFDISRSVLMCGAVDGKSRLRYLSHEKCSYAPLSQTTLFSVEDNAACFSGFSEKHDRDFVLEAQASIKKGDRAPERATAENFILDFLREHNGHASVRQLNEAADACSICERTLKRARQTLTEAGKIRAEKGREWSLVLLSV